MEELKKQVTRAHRRITLQRFLTILAWSLFGTFLVAAIAIAIPKIWVLGLDTTIWKWSWIGGALTVGLLTSLGWVLFNRRSPLDAAIEIDRRFGLKERVSSTFSLSEQELESEFGEALIADASRRVERLDISEQFRFKGRWMNLLPVAPAIIAFLIASFVPDAISLPAKKAEAASIEVKKRIQKSTDDLKKKWAEQRKKAEEKDLPSAKLLGELEQGAEQLNKLQNIDKQKALVKLNDLKKSIEARRNKIGDVSKLQKQLNQLKNLKPGPASKLNKALKEGDFSKALAELNDLKNQLSTGTMNKKDQQALAEQLKQLASKMQQTAEAHEMAKQELRKQISQAKKAGDNATAGELQRKMDKLNAQNQQMKKMKQMAQKLQSASQAAQSGQAQKAAAEMDALAQDLEDLKTELEEMGMLDEAMEQLADAKDRMNCEECDGEGCSSCMGSQGMGSMGGRIPGQGLGEGQGVGDRPEAETDKSFYDSQVRAKPRKGKAVTTGYASGKNIAGEALEEVKDALQAAKNDASDPLTDVRLPKEHRDHAREYFESFNPDH